MSGVGVRGYVVWERVCKYGLMEGNVTIDQLGTMYIKSIVSRLQTYTDGFCCSSLPCEPT